MDSSAGPYAITLRQNRPTIFAEAASPLHLDLRCSIQPPDPSAPLTFVAVLEKSSFHFVDYITVTSCVNTVRSWRSRLIFTLERCKSSENLLKIASAGGIAPTSWSSSPWTSIYHGGPGGMSNIPTFTCTFSRFGQ
ncbi:hypothetical protein HPB50_024394 [Hyalomma asiaticum]|uniref:Uncharacterized protein n=1 Tax=Hyalomma asiaticum TaxID=266040 RepID=A0ACB7S8Y5_HYAAI|nr:hypothetical protein HPB50_024394 [Hyalomma asiaticum]